MSGLSAEYILKHDSKPAHCFSSFVQGKGYVGTSDEPNYAEQLAKRRADELADMNFASGYAEPGYTDPEKCILFANWNCFSQEVSDVLERAGYSIEWSDEWTTCSECNKAVRTSPDSYDYAPYYVIENDCELVCLNCIDWDSYLESIEDNPRKACMPQCNPAEHGYTLLSDRHETGLHVGMNDDPKKTLKELQAKGYEHIVFRISETSQFYITWEVWQKNAEEESE